MDQVPVDGVAGSLWLCGKHLIGPDHEAAMERVDAGRVFCLNEAHELADRYGTYVDWLRSDDDRVRWHPIPDLHAPDAERAAAIVDQVVGDLRSGRSVIVHCGAGIGRAGTLAAAVLVRLGLSPADALEVVAASRPMAGPEAGAQRTLLDDLHALWG